MDVSDLISLLLLAVDKPSSTDYNLSMDAGWSDSDSDFHHPKRKNTKMLQHSNKQVPKH